MSPQRLARLRTAVIRPYWLRTSARSTARAAQVCTGARLGPEWVTVARSSPLA